MSIQSKIQSGIQSGNLNLSSEDVPSETSTAEEGDVADVQQPKLQTTDLEGMQKMRILMGYEAAAAREDARQLESAKRALERDEQIEARLSPLSITDILFSDRVVQDVPISDNLRLEFGTVPSTVALLFRGAIKQYCDETRVDSTTIKEQDRGFLEALASLSAGLLRINNTPQPAVEITAETDPVRVQRLLVDAMKVHSRRPIILLEQLIHHQRLFIMRVRKVLEHEGYVEQEVKKS